MLRNALMMGVLGLLGSGCAMSGKDSIWMFFISLGGDEECTETVEHNYVGADVPVDDTTSDWTETIETEASDGIVFGQIFSSAGGEESKLLVIGSDVYTGTKEGGIWTFEWTNYSEDVQTDTHVTQYHFTSSSIEEVHTVLELDFKGNTATGTFTNHQTTTRAWDESDTWDVNEVGNAGGRTPVWNYLEMVADQSQTRNTYDTVDCSGTNCELSVSEHCMQSGAVEAHETDYDEDAFDAVRGAGQPVGLGAN